jgi:hypothetical protein
MADRWYYSWDNNQKIGPFSAQELRELADKGQIQAMDTVWKEGVEQGVYAHQVKNLFAPPPEDDFPLEDESAQAAPAEPAEPARAVPETAIVIDLAAADPSAAAQKADAKSGDSSVTITTPDEPEEAPPPPAKKPPTHQAPKGRAISAKGAIIVSQNGTSVQIQKKCITCGYLDTSKSSMPIRSGTTRTTFFCRKCRKMRPVEVLGII